MPCYSMQHNMSGFVPNRFGYCTLNKDNIVYLGIYDGNNFDIETFKMSQSRNLLRSRSQNYAMIRLLNWFNK